TKPETGGMFVAFVVTDLRGKALRDELTSGLKGICADLPILPRYRIYVYGDRRLAQIAEDNMSKIPNIDDPAYQTLQSGLLAKYAPETGTITLNTDERLAIGRDWCKK